MTISHDKKLIFIQIPKNAGTAILRAMKYDGDYFNDTHIVNYKEHYKEYWDEYIKFTVIRDPIDRFISAYKFARMKESWWFSSTTRREGIKIHPHFHLCSKMDINEYISYIHETHDLNIWIFPQTFTIDYENNLDQIDYFVRFENLKKDLSKIGIDLFEKFNQSKINNKNLIKLTNESKKKLFEIYASDYKKLNFKKPICNYQ